MDLLLLLLGAFSELCSTILKPDLDTSRIELSLGGQLFSPVDIRIVSPIEGCLELVKLAGRERGSISFGAHRVEEEEGGRVRGTLAHDSDHSTVSIVCCRLLLPIRRRFLVLSCANNLASRFHCLFFLTFFLLFVFCSFFARARSSARSLIDLADDLQQQHYVVTESGR